MVALLDRHARYDAVMRWGFLAMVACSSSAPPPRGPPAPSAPSAAPLAGEPSPPPTRPPPSLGPIVTQPCPRTSPIVLTTTSVSWHRDLCRYVDDAVVKLGPVFVARSANVTITVSLSMTSTSPVRCKIGVDIVRPTTRVAKLDGGAKVTGADIALQRQDCMQAIVEDMFVRKIGPLLALTTARSTAPSSGSAGSASAPLAP